jgi:hypothetical protein
MIAALENLARPRRVRPWRVILGATAGCWLSAMIFCGCGYTLGPTNGLRAGSKTIQINPFQNQTIEPRLSEAITAALRKQLQQDGTYRLDSHGEGDVIVTGVITRYDRGELSFSPRDVLTVRDYSLRLTARIVAIDRATGHTNLNQVVYGQTTVRVGADLTSSERQAIPILAGDFARHATSSLVDGTW